MARSKLGGKPPMTRKRTRLSKTARRRQLLDLAVTLCATLGISGVSHADVAREADVSVSTVFSYFATRRIMINAVFREVQRYSRCVMMDVSRDSPPRTILFNMLWSGINSAPDESRYLKIWVEWGSSFRNDVWPQYIKAQRKAAAIMKEVLAEGQMSGSIDAEIDIEIASRILADGSRSVASMYFMEADKKIIEALVWNWVDSALHVGLTHSLLTGGEVQRQNRAKMQHAVVSQTH